MKALHTMNNLDKAELLTRLFPQELPNLQHCIKNQCRYFLEHETAIREGWQEAGFLTAEFWYRLVQNARKEIEKYQERLWKRPRMLTDHFFDGYNSLFSIHCLITYAETTECNPQLKQAIHLLFGNEQLLTINNI